jgi:hypothetical protein
VANIVCYGSDGSVLSHYTQWDKNQKLIIRGVDMSSTPQFHFSNSFTDSSLIVSPLISSDGVSAIVPDTLLQYAEPIIVHLYYKGVDSESSKYSVRIPVMPKKKPENYTQSSGHDGIILNGANIKISDTAPSINSILWFDTRAIE